MRKQSVIFFVLTCAFLASSCAKEQSSFFRDGKIHLRVAADKSRASAITTEGISVTPGKFCLDAYINEDCGAEWEGTHKAGDLYFGGKGNDNVKYDEASMSWQIDNAPTWLLGVGLHFWSRIGLPESEIDYDNSVLYPAGAQDGKVKLAFEHSLPASVPGSDATNQTDVILAYNACTYSQGGEETVNIHFYHALCEIRFAVSPSDGTFNAGSTIKSLSLVRIPGTGSCVFNGGDNTFVWSDQTNPGTYSQTYNIAVSAISDSWKAHVNGNTGKAVEGLYDTTNNFFVIPHTLDDEACVKMVVNDGSSDINVLSFIGGKGDAWEPGKYYTYKLNYKPNATGEMTLYAELVEWGSRQDVDKPLND